MKIQSLRTPAILLDMDALEKNIQTYQNACEANSKQLWPMVKTHKSLEIAKMQADAGATGFLCGTLDECEALCDAGYKSLMYAYPVASRESIDRVIALASKCDFIIRLDDLDGAEIVNATAIEAGVVISYTIIVDCGLHRFGMAPEKVVAFADALKEKSGLKLRGISSHSGEVYAAAAADEVPGYAKKEMEAIAAAVASLSEAGYSTEIISTGSTPTFSMTLADKNIGIYHPGNYVFNDCIQMSNGTATEDDCALTVLATIISHPSEHLFICDAGAKCLGLDQGAHGNASIIGHGRVKGHPEVIVDGLSEEVGKLKVSGETTLKVGDKIEIIPNHSCSTANLTEYYITKCGDTALNTITVDVRSNSQIPLI